MTSSESEEFLDSYELLDQLNDSSTLSITNPFHKFSHSNKTRPKHQTLSNSANTRIKTETGQYGLNRVGVMDNYETTSKIAHPTSTQINISQKSDGQNESKLKNSTKIPNFDETQIINNPQFINSTHEYATKGIYS